MSIQVSRRSFLKVGLIGAITLAAVGGVYRMKSQATPLSKFVFDSDAKTALMAIIPVILGLPLTPQEVDKGVSHVQTAIHGLPLIAQKEVQDLFGILVLGPTRRFLVGIPDEWAKAKPDDIAAFLQSWRFHRIGMLQSAYHALHDLIIGPWYADSATWASIGYPGPIKELL